jgi:hypothetical protein
MRMRFGDLPHPYQPAPKCSLNPTNTLRHAYTHLTPARVIDSARHEVPAFPHTSHTLPLPLCRCSATTRSKSPKGVQLRSRGALFYVW